MDCLRAEAIWCSDVCLQNDASELVWESVTISAVRDDLGHVAHYLKIGRDIMAKRQALEKLRQSEESYRRLMELAPDNITITRLSDGEYFEVNESFCKETGFSYEEVIGRTATDIHIYANPQDRQRVVQQLR